jgi:hypothetical protein
VAFFAIIVAALFISLLARSDTVVARTVPPQTDAESFMAADTDVATEAAPVHALSTVTTTSAPDAATLDTTAIDSDTQFAAGAGNGLVIAPDATVTTLAGATALDGTLAAQDAGTNSSAGTFAVDGNTLTRAIITIGIGAVFLVLGYVTLISRGSLHRRRMSGQVPSDQVQPRHPGTAHALQEEGMIGHGGPIPIAGPLGPTHKAIPAPAPP